VEDSIEWQAIDIIWKNTASIPPPDSHIRWAPPKSGDHFCSPVIRINRIRQSRVGSSQPGTFLALESGFINQRRARVRGVRASWAVLQAMLQGILKAAGPVGYYSKVLKGVFYGSILVLECFIPGLLQEQWFKSGRRDLAMNSSVLAQPRIIQFTNSTHAIHEWHMPFANGRP
jgi:hypothetical protein